MSSSDPYSFDSESALSEDPDGALPVWRRSKQRDSSECEEAGASTPTRVSNRRSRRHASASGGHGTETASLLDGRSSSPSECEDTEVHWVQALCLALLALTSALFIGAVALGLMHSLPATWPTPQAPPTDAASVVTSADNYFRVNPSLDTTRRSPAVQHAGRLDDATPMRGVASLTASTAGHTSTAAPGSSRAVTTPQDEVAAISERCLRVFYKYCLKPRREFYFDAAANACVPLSRHDGSEVCIRSPNRFATAHACSRQCVRTSSPADRCSRTALLSTCAKDDVINGTNMWFFDGHSCRLWHFPSGKCPRGQLFATAGQCRDTCMRRSGGFCRVPAPTTCSSRQLRFPFFATDFGRRHSLRCLPTVTAAEASRRCLAGANRFSTRAACRTACSPGTSKNRPPDTDTFLEA